MAGLEEFYCRSNETSLGSQFKWLEYTFNLQIFGQIGYLSCLPVYWTRRLCSGEIIVFFQGLQAGAPWEMLGRTSEGLQAGAGSGLQASPQVLQSATVDDLSNSWHLTKFKGHKRFQLIQDTLVCCSLLFSLFFIFCRSPFIRWFLQHICVTLIKVFFWSKFIIFLPRA